jgi:hypothetical protein
MSGEAKPSYPPGATRTVSVKATPEQKSTWEAVGHNHGLSAGGFLAFTADLYLAMYHAYLRANDAHYDALHPAGLAETERRQEERVKRREGER